jgi:hypothetical protein
MDRLIDEIALSCAITPILASTFAISKISPLPSQRDLNLDRLIEVAPPVGIKLHTERTESANSRQSRFSAPK